MAVVSLAVIGFFRRQDGSGANVWRHQIAPGLAFLLLGTLVVLIVQNFNVLLGQQETTALTFILPALILIPGIVGIVWALKLKRTHPELYRVIGHGRPAPGTNRE
jgi:hypothetical protein